MTISNHKLSTELDYVLESYLFENKLQMQRILSYLVRHMNAASNDAYKQKTIARECLGRGKDFDPAENPVVRIEIGRLRKLLEQFYQGEDSRPYRIMIPMGQYRPVITLVENTEQAMYLPELIPSPANPERLTVLLQFATEGEEIPDLYLLRHQIRIGITIALGRQQAVRLLVALPNEDGKVSDSIDYIMRLSLSAVGDHFEMKSQVICADSDEALVSWQGSLFRQYSKSELKTLMSLYVSALFDHEFGELWRYWVEDRRGYDKIGASKVTALVEYQRFLQSQTAVAAKKAFSCLKRAADNHPGEKIINHALADLYLRIVVSGYELAEDPVVEGLRHLREALRFSPESEQLHTIHSLLQLFSQESDVIEYQVVQSNLEHEIMHFSCLFNQLLLRSLTGGWTDSFVKLKQLCDRYAYYPRLYSALQFLDDCFASEVITAGSNQLNPQLDDLYPATMLLVQHIVLPEDWQGCRQTLLSIIRRRWGKDD